MEEPGGGRRRPWFWVAILVIFAGMIGTGLALSRVRVGADDWLARNLRVQETAHAWGEKTTEAGCVAEGIRRAARCHRMAVGCMTATNLFTIGCMEVAEESPTLCEGVPDPLRVLRSARWQLDWCERGGSPGEGCIAIARTVQRRCFGP
jgi:hypothetical protein